MTGSGSNPAVLILDPNARVLAGTVSGGDSIAMFLAGERIYVCADDRLGRANVTAGVVILEADTGRELGSFGLNDAPAFIRQPILAGSGGRLYLDIDDLDGRLEVVDTSTLNVVARIRIDASEDQQLRSIPAAAVLSPDGRCLYVANQGVRLSRMRRPRSAGFRWSRAPVSSLMRSLFSRPPSTNVRAPTRNSSQSAPQATVW
jgi:hypothetical protein